MTGISAKMSLVLAAGAMALSACASDGAEQNRAAEKADILARKGEAVDGICFTRGIDRFGPTASDVVVVRARNNEKYLIETMGCLDLGRTQKLTIASQGMCVKDGDYLVASEQIFEPGQRCLVTGTYTWNEQG